MRHRRVARTMGAILRVFAFMFLIPAVASLIWDEDIEPLGWAGPMKQTTVSFVLVGIVTFLLGMMLANWGTPRDYDELREREAFFIVGITWFVCASIGALPFLLTGATQDPTIAMFEAMSAITTTGFSALAFPLENLPDSVHVWRATLHLFGGVGIVVVAVAVLARLTEGAVKLFGGESIGDVARIRPKLTQTAKSLFGIYMGLNVLFFFAFLLTMHYTGERHGWARASFHALVHAFSAVATGGMSTRTDSIGAFDSVPVVVVGMLAMFIGGISLPLIYQFTHGEWVAFWRNGEFRFYLVMVALPSLAVLGLLFLQGFSLADSALRAPVYVIATISTGGLTVGSAEPFADSVKLVLMVLMFTGAMVGSTTGALKLSRILVLLRLVQFELQRLLHPHAVSVLKFGGRIIPEQATRRIVVFFFSYVTIFIAGAIAFSIVGFDFETSVVASAATLGNVGYGWGGVANGFINPVGEAARAIAIVLMWMGRVEIFTALLLFVPATYRD